MKTLYERNGLVFWDEAEIHAREMMTGWFVRCVTQCLKDQNKVFDVMRVEAPLLTPRDFINPNYTDDDIYALDDLALRPETTMGSYAYARHLLESHAKVKMPLCVWQLGKSFRREQDQPLGKMKLKEFYQLEFQCIYGLTTKNDYSESLIPVVQNMIEKFVGTCRVEDSDRLPHYAEWTRDVVCNDMEVCSMSLRKDFPDAKCFEIAIGMDRCLFHFEQK